MSLSIGDTVHTQSGRLYVVRTLYAGMRGNELAGLAPPMPRPGRRRTVAHVETLTLVRTRELSLAFHYAARGDQDGTDARRRGNLYKLAAHWLAQAEHRNDDSRAALCLGSDRLLELEAA